MADKTSIFKVNIDISNIDQHRYQQLCFTVARDDNEDMSHLVMRLIAYAMVPEEKLSFGKGVCIGATPDVAVRDYDDHFVYWIDIGYPSTERIKKASHQSDNVIIFSLIDSQWLKESHNELMTMNNVNLVLFKPDVIDKLAKNIVGRNITWSLVIDGDKLGISNEDSYVETKISRMHSSHLPSPQVAAI